jgi:hypothetical protein
MKNEYFSSGQGVVDCSTASRKERKNNPWLLAPGHVSAVLGPAMRKWSRNGRER